MSTPEKPSPSKSPGFTQKKLGSNGAQKISRLILDCMNDVETALKLPPAPAMLQSDSVPGEHVTELSEALKKHSTIAEEHLKQKPLGTEDEDTVERSRRAKLDKELKDSFRDVLRLMREHPDARDALKATLDTELGESEDKFSRSLKMFHSQLEDALMGCPKSKLQASPHLTAQKHQDQVLKEETADKIKKINARIAEKMKENKGLEEYFNQNGQDEDKAKKIRKGTPVEGPHVFSMPIEVDQQKMLNQQKMLYKLMFQNRETERLMQEQNQKVEMEDEELLQNFENEMKETQAKLEFDGEELRKAEEVMMMLREPFAFLEEEYNKIQERERLAEEKKQKEMEELVMKTKAAIIVQAWWRGYRTRCTLKNQSKEKKPKKGKGKKK